MTHKDSFQKLAEDMWGPIDKIMQAKDGLFHRVRKQDLEEIVIAFAVNVAQLEYADNFRIYPLHQAREYKAQANRGCCGSWDTQYKCLSGNIYWRGCNYGH